MTDKIDKDAEMGSEKKGNPLPIIIAAFIMMAIAAGIGVYQKQSKTVADTGIIPEKQKAVDLVQMQKRLGPEWRMIEMVQDKWYGPFKIKNGSAWKIAKGEIWVKIDDRVPFHDKPGQLHSKSGNKIMFLSVNDGTVFFFKH
ncbi:MAG: hypothetical protein KAV41_01055 [Candidatus Pacebacteria bacterium]|nr:hypothetical protein [Candidatus Paceibacterota bacterium]